MSGLKGSRELNKRLKAIKLTFKVAGRDWAEEAVEQMRPAVPVRSGKLRKSFRVKNATQRKATVAGHYTAFFIDAGTVAHPIAARKAKTLAWRGRRDTIFAKKVQHPRQGARPFRERAAHEALRRRPMAAALVKLWNRAA